MTLRMCNLCQMNSIIMLVKIVSMSLSKRQLNRTNECKIFLSFNDSSNYLKAI